jgi:hypothetical protein
MFVKKRYVYSIGNYPYGNGEFYCMQVITDLSRRRNHTALLPVKVPQKTILVLPEKHFQKQRRVIKIILIIGVKGVN